MKKALITLLLIASTGAYGQSIYSQRNPATGGENFYSGGRFIGYTQRNPATGGRDFYRAPGMHGYQGYGNPELQSGYAIGAGLRSIINAFRGNGVER